ncbi:MAG TPA: YCF48-related protein [Pyrinomonadaceae bacterium]|jgi:photosystem II stability/assembly factor-like uncharacterized protein|nr:YCF48-related protein [Pyrinomonadaceae bacterium]
MEKKIVVRTAQMTNDKCQTTNVKWLFLIVLLLITPSFVIAANWGKQTSGTLGWLHAVFFLDQKTGWAVGSKGALLTTSDGGASWKIQDRPTDDSISDVYFSNAQNGWLVCEANIYELKTREAPRTYLMHTEDGGETWQKVDINGDDKRFGNVDTRLTRVLFSPNGRGWVFGEAGTTYTSTDEGLTWKRVQVPTRFLLLGGAFVDNDRGWLVGAGGTIMQTSDGGDTWHASRLPEMRTTKFTSVSFIDNRLGWAVGTGGRILRTVNGGRTWTEQKSNVTVDLLDVKFLNDLEGWAVGSGGTIIRTFDGGLHWSTEPSGTSHPLERIFLTDRDHGWAVGFGGTIVAYGSVHAAVLR